MPGVADPFAVRPDGPAPLSSIGLDPLGARPSPGDRILAAFWRRRLTLTLSTGAAFGGSGQLALRARQLTSERNRMTLARGLNRTIAEAHRRSRRTAAVVPIERAAVLEAEGVILAVIARLTDPDPVAPQGVALMERILTNADCSPLYNRSEPGSLRRMISAARAALDGDSAPLHDFDLGV